MTLLPSTRARDSSPGYKVDISRGQRIGRVSSEWFSRPDDERYLSLSDLYDAVRARAETATAHTVETRAIRVVATPDEPERLSLLLPDREAPVAPTHWSFGQMCSLVGAPSAYLRQLPAALAGINMQHGLLAHRGELVKTLETGDGRAELRAVHEDTQPSTLSVFYCDAAVGRVDEFAPEDVVFEDHGIKVLVDPKSLAYIDGTELDFVREGLNEGFKFNNPNERDRCGCGESFRI